MYVELHDVSACMCELHTLNINKKKKEERGEGKAHGNRRLMNIRNAQLQTSISGSGGSSSYLWRKQYLM